MEEITSVSNNKIKETAKLAQKKYRNEKGLFLLEGEKPVKEAFDSGVEIETVFTLEKFVHRFDFLKDKIIVVTEPVLAKISTTDSMPEVAAVAVQRNYSLDDVKGCRRVLLIENVKDAGNLGTLIRSACAFGIEAVVLCGDTVDIYNPKVVRSAVGAMFKVPIVKVPYANSKAGANSQPSDYMKQVRECFKESVFAASVVNHEDALNPAEIDYTKPFVLMLGSEAEGLSPQAIEAADIKTTIPISKYTESLNLACAGAVLLYISSRKVQ